MVDGEPFALKVLLVNHHANQDEDEYDQESHFDEFFERARREFNVLSRCTSSHLVKPGPIGFSTTSIDDCPIVYFTEEWIEGQTLGDLIERDPIDVPSAAALARQLSDAVEDLWEHRHVHRDIKPHNIIQREFRDFVLLDMGIAFDVDATELTLPGQLPHSKGYTSPDQMNLTNKRQLNFRSDMFLIGVVLYEDVTQIHPFSAHTRGKMETLTAILSETPRPPSRYRSDLPPEFDNFVMRLLSKRAHFRYRSFDRMRSAIDLFS